MRLRALSSNTLAALLTGYAAGDKASTPQQCIRRSFPALSCPIEHRYSFIHIPASSPPANHDHCSAAHQCAVLSAQKELAGRVYGPRSDEYVAQQATYWSLDNALLAPECIVLPQTAQEVALAVKTLTVGGNSSGSAGCQFAIRSGGHMDNTGANNIHAGVTIDLGYINSTVYKPDQNIASVGPGARWGSVYTELAKSEVMVAGGRASTVGVGGLLLGGGNSFYAARRGFACDGLANFEIVLADGTLDNANASHNPDLYRALKGGSSNFGVVTRFDLETFTAPSTLWGGTVGYLNTSSAALIRAMYNFGEAAGQHPDSSVIIFWTFTQGSGAAAPTVIGAFHNTAGVADAPQYKEFLSTPGNITSSMRKDSLVGLTSELGVPRGSFNTWSALAFKNNEAVMAYAVAAYQAMMDELQAEAAPGLNFSAQCMFQPLSTVQFRQAARNGGNVLGLEDRTENLILFLGMLGYKDQAQKPLVDRKMRAWTAQIKAFAKTQGADDDFLFLNYADISQSPFRGYGERNLQFLKDVAAKYDPEAVFQTRVPGGFKISKA